VHVVLLVELDDHLVLESVEELDLALIQVPAPHTAAPEHNLGKVPVLSVEGGLLVCYAPVTVRDVGDLFGKAVLSC